MIIVDQEIVEAVMPRMSGRRRTEQERIVVAISRNLQETLARYQIDTPLRVAHFLAQVAHESAGFCTCEEYASGEAYEGRRDLGNTKAGDGVRFKGRGLIQLTGRTNYDVYGKRVKAHIDPRTLIDHPELAADPALSLILACEYWTHRVKGGLNPLADKDDIVAITKLINGGQNGLDDRRRYLARAKQALARAQAIGIAARQPESARQVLRRGMKVDQVAELQRQLAAAGFPVTIDGDFGPGTEAMVKAFQRARGLEADGIVGAATWSALVTGVRPPGEPVDA